MEPPHTLRDEPAQVGPRDRDDRDRPAGEAENREKRDVEDEASEECHAPSVVSSRGWRVPWIRRHGCGCDTTRAPHSPRRYHGALILGRGIVGSVKGVSIDGPAGRLEVALRSAVSPRAAAVLAHPHPLYGGTLHNPVVFHADRELNRAGLVTARFNFRGVGASEGEHDRGRGEPGDVGAVASWLRGETDGVPLLVVGYSFGAWCGLRHASENTEVAAFVGIGLPVRHYDFRALADFDRPLAIVQGTDDELGTPDEVRAVLGSATRATVHEVPGATHLFPNRAPEVGRLVATATLALLDELDARTD
jgi:alpha/beta superfamily hydrolase